MQHMYDKWPMAKRNWFGNGLGPWSSLFTQLRAVRARMLACLFLSNTPKKTNVPVGGGRFRELLDRPNSKEFGLREGEEET